MKTLFFRIGSDKAGTVSLGRFATENNDLLLSRGVYAPNRNCIHLLGLLADRVGFEPSPGPRFKDPSPRRRQAIEDLLDAYPHDVPDTIFLTTEVVWGRLSRGASPPRADVLKLLRAIAQTFGEHQIKIILHIRRIDLYLESLFKQDVKAGRNVSLDRLMNTTTAEAAQSFFGALEEVFGSDNIIVRPFERSQLYKGDVVADTLRELGLEDMVGEVELPSANEGLHRDLMEALIVMNEEEGKIVPNDKLLGISNSLAKDYGFPDEKHLLDRATREQLLLNFRGFYDYLAESYGHGGLLFKDSLPDDAHLDYELSQEKFELIRQLILVEAGRA